jgi:molybdopterin-guanine dinucleotide biosynthesis protein A
MNMPFDDITAAVLSGGKGTRLGGIDKIMIEVDGKTILSRTLQVLRPLFKKIIIAGTGSNIESETGITIVRDRFPGTGPLAGIDAALSASDTTYLFVFAGDMPWLSMDMIISQVRFMYDNPCDIVVPRVGSLIEPLHSIFSRRLLPTLEEYLKTNSDHAVRNFYSRAQVRYFDVVLSDYNQGVFANINTPDDLRNAKQG